MAARAVILQLATSPTPPNNIEQLVCFLKEYRLLAWIRLGNTETLIGGNMWNHIPLSAS